MGQSSRPACRRMLFNVPACKSALSLPGTVTRPFLILCVNWRWLPLVATRVHPSSSRRRMISFTVVGMDHEHPVVLPQGSHLRQVALGAIVESAHFLPA